MITHTHTHTRTACRDVIAQCLFRYHKMCQLHKGHQCYCFYPKMKHYVCQTVITREKKSRGDGDEF